MITDVEVRIVQRRTGDGRPFSEILYVFRKDGRLSCALSRTWWVVDDTPMAREQEKQAFLRRQARPYSDGSMP